MYNDVFYIVIAIDSCASIFKNFWFDRFEDLLNVGKFDNVEQN